MIISGFAGIGKTYYANKFPDVSIDLDSSNFKWIFDKTIQNINIEERKGLCNKKINPAWPMNYIEAIKDANEKFGIVFISIDEEIRMILKDLGIRYFVAFPALDCKDEYIERYKSRNNGINFINLLEVKYEEWIQGLLTESNQIRLRKGEYISDKIG